MKNLIKSILDFFRTKDATTVVTPEPESVEKTETPPVVDTVEKTKSKPRPKSKAKPKPKSKTSTPKAKPKPKPMVKK